MQRVSRPGAWLRRWLWAVVLFGLFSFVSVINARLARWVSLAPRMMGRAVARLWRARDGLRQQRDREVRTLREQICIDLNCSQIPELPLPEGDDILVFLFGIPVVPWLKRVGIQQWNMWLDHLAQTLRLRYPERADIAPGAPWEEWVRRHVRYIEVHFARIAGLRLAQSLNSLPQSKGSIYLFGHSTGGAAILQYLADLRDGIVPAPSLPIRAALTMDAAVTGPSRLWTGWPLANERPSHLDHVIPARRSYLRLTPRAESEQLGWRRSISWFHNYLETPFKSLGTWAQEEGIALLSISNVADAFTHGQLGDIPFLRLRIGRRFDLWSILTGKAHICVQRDPRMPPFLWWHEGLPARPFNRKP